MKKSPFVLSLMMMMMGSVPSVHALEVEPTDISDALNFTPEQSKMLGERSVGAAMGMRSLEIPARTNLGATVAKSMKVATVPEQFDCPLFSNSPYADILTALDSLQGAINLFDECKNDPRGQQLAEMGRDLRAKILVTKNASENGATASGSQMDNILSQAAYFQDLLSNAVNVPACYKDPSKKMIFSINDTIQSLAPLALEFVTKNPALSSTFLPVLTGANAISQGISTLEKVLSETATLNLSDAGEGPQNRLAVIKNTCQFMKVYNRIEYLTLSRAERLKKINADFSAQLQPLQKQEISLTQVLNQNKVAPSASEKKILAVKERTQKTLQTVEDAVNEIAFSREARSQCSVIRTLSRMNSVLGLQNDLELMSSEIALEDKMEFKSNRLKDLQLDIKNLNSNNLEECVTLGMDWISSLKDVGQEILKVSNQFEQNNSQLMGALSAQDALGKIKTKTRNLRENRLKMEKFTELSVFEPGEIAKRLRNMPRFLFNGPNGTILQSLLKNGPVYDFLQNNESNLKLAKVDFVSALNEVINLESGGKPLRFNSMQDVRDHYESVKLYKIKALTRSQLMATESYTPYCAALTKAIKSYINATDFLGANQYFCQMIKPALKESAVSEKLKSYCESKANGGPKAGYLQSIKVLLVDGYKSQVETIMDRKAHLECDAL